MKTDNLISKMSAGGFTLKLYQDGHSLSKEQIETAHEALEGAIHFFVGVGDRTIVKGLNLDRLSIENYLESLK